MCIFVLFSFEIMFISLCGFYLFLFSKYCLTGSLKQIQYVMKSISIQGDSLPAHLQTLQQKILIIPISALFYLEKRGTSTYT